MKILLLFQDWFKDELREAGHEVISCGADGHFDVRLTSHLLRYPEVEKLVGFHPDRIIVFDNSIPIFIAGLEEAGVPLIFYAVDVQHHIERHALLPLFFDHVLVAQKDYLPLMRGDGASLTWMPLWAPRLVEPSEEKKFDALFVGTVNVALNPERVSFLSALESRVPLVCLQGEYWNLFPHARVVLNQTVRGDLNFRVFEALMCGSPLVTERSGNGLTDLFTPELHLLTYPRGDVTEAASQIRRLLEDPSLQKRIGEAGRVEVLRSHRPCHRAQCILDLISSLTPRRRSLFAMVRNFSDLGRFLERDSPRLAEQALSEALLYAERGLLAGESMDFDLAREILSAASYFDTISSSSRARELTGKLCESYPEYFAHG